jgi:dihydrofolate reductase
MKISFLVVMSKNRVIGANGKIPWHLANDLKRFKSVSMGKPIVMGRKTYESIGKPLPNRRNIILSFNQHLEIAGCEVYHSAPEVLAVLADAAEIIIIGGEEIYNLFFPVVDTIYLTIVHAAFAGDRYFKELVKQEWQEIEHQDFPSNQQNPYPYSFITLKRKNP